MHVAGAQRRTDLSKTRYWRISRARHRTSASQHRAVRIDDEHACTRKCIVLRAPWLWCHRADEANWEHRFGANGQVYKFAVFHNGVEGIARAIAGFSGFAVTPEALSMGAVWDVSE